VPAPEAIAPQRAFDGGPALNWVVFAMLAWLALGLERGLKPMLMLQGGSLTLAPSFVMTLAVFVSMIAPARGRAVVVPWGSG
jgi:hypothetical protein